MTHRKAFKAQAHRGVTNKTVPLQPRAKATLTPAGGWQRRARRDGAIRAAKGALGRRASLLIAAGGRAVDA